MSKSLFQTSSDYDYQLQANRVDIWQVPLGIYSTWANNILSEDELIRANRFYFIHHQHRFTMARAILRIILAKYLSREASELKFSYHKQGKPYVINDRNLEFNLSHSGEIALIAIGQQHSLGIDIELFSARPYQGIAEHLFSPIEILALSSLADRLKPLAFFSIWSQKEAFIKTSGLGLSYPTQQFTVPILPSEPVLITDPIHQCNQKMIAFMPAIACSAALCCHPSISNFHYYRYNSNDFISVFNEKI